MVLPQSALKLNLFQIVCGRPFLVSVLILRLIKSFKKCTTFRANINNVTQVFSLQLSILVWWALKPVLVKLLKLTKDLGDSRFENQLYKQWTGLYHILLATLFLKVNRNQALYSPNSDKASTSWGGVRSCCCYWYWNRNLDVYSWNLKLKVEKYSTSQN